MRKLLASLLLCSCVCFAAEHRRVVNWQPGDPNFTVLYFNGRAVERIVDGGRTVDVFAPILRDKHTYEVMVGVINLTPEAIDLDPIKIGSFSTDPSRIPMPSTDADAKLSNEERSQQRWAALGSA